MTWRRFGRRGDAASGELSDTDLVGLFATEPQRAWDFFIERYAGLVLATLQGMGFDQDEAMDRFVFVCEKLCEGRFRRLRSVRFAGNRGELVPWIRTVVKNLAVSWAWSKEGRKRLFKSVAELPAREQRVFELYFWRGLSPSEVFEHLRLEEKHPLRPEAVYDALEVIFSHLDANQRWRLMSQLMRNREAVPVAAEDPRTRGTFEPIASQPNPEEAALLRERQRRLEGAVAGLAARDRLILQLRFEEALALTEVAAIVHLSLSGVKASLRRSLGRLREIVRDVGPHGEESPWPA